jgi:hypothetical protein
MRDKPGACSSNRKRWPLRRVAGLRRLQRHARRSRRALFPQPFPAYISLVPEFSDLFAILQEQTTTVSLGPTGFVPIASDAARAYDQLGQLSPEEVARHRQILEATLRDGPGAARIYAALILRRIDPATADAHLDEMLASTEACSFEPGGSVCFGGTVGSTAAYLHDLLGTPRARALCKLVSEFRGATCYAEPDANAQNAWGVRFADLLARTDLVIAHAVIGSLASEDPPVGLFGVVLLSRIDRDLAERRLERFARSSAQVPVISSPRDRSVTLAVADIARSWLDSPDGRLPR